MDDLIAFVTARLDEDDARAQAMEHVTADSQLYACPATRTEPLGDLEWGEEACDCGLAARKGRVLREVAAKRAIVGAHISAATADRLPSTEPYLDGYTSATQVAMESLAAVYSDHPDYRAEFEA